MPTSLVSISAENVKQATARELCDSFGIVTRPEASRVFAIGKASKKSKKKRSGKQGFDLGVIYRGGWLASQFSQASLSSASDRAEEAQGPGVDDLIAQLAQSATAESIPKIDEASSLRLISGILAMVDLDDRPSQMLPADAVQAVMVAASLPALCHHFSANVEIGDSKERLDTIVQWLRHLADTFNDSDGQQAHPELSACLECVLGVELPLTLAWRMPATESKRVASAKKRLHAWQQRADTIPSLLEQDQAKHLRIAIASLLRIEKLSQQVWKHKTTKTFGDFGFEAMTWALALTSRSGQPVWPLIEQDGDQNRGPSGTTLKNKRMFIDDIGPHGILRQACHWDAKTLTPALDAALGDSKSGGKLAWQISLPDTMLHDEDAQKVVMLPEWDVHRGRTWIDYRCTEPQLAIHVAGESLIQGAINTELTFAGKRVHPESEWEAACEFNDDEIHFLECEQLWSDGIRLQRQWTLLRDERIIMIADAVLPPKDQWDQQAELDQKANQRSPIETLPEITLQCKYPFGPRVQANAASETRELFLEQGKTRAMVIPLAANEWRVGPTAAELIPHDDHMLLRSTGRGAIYSALWIDLQRRRFSRPRTWRQLTVAEDLRLCGRHEATGFRMQSGSEQWMVYRALTPASRLRTVLGKHILSDFLLTRFHAGDGAHEDLVNVDDDPS